MIFILDTNILVHAVRESTLFSNLDAQFNLTNVSQQNIISAVTIGELYAIALRNNWGIRKKEKLELLLHEFRVFPVSDNRILHEAYADIDAFSQNHHPFLTLSGTSRNMAKNDLWIAATTLVFQATLLTTDADFDHLHNSFFTVHRIIP